MAHPPLTLTWHRPWKSWDEGWADFRSDHPGWPAAADTGEPLYCLPDAVIDRLAGGRGGPPFAGDAAEAERAFAVLCDYHDAVGCWCGQPVKCPYLRPPTPPPDDRALRAHGLTPDQCAAVQEQLDEAPAPHRRLTGYAGWLLTDPDFLGDVRRLAGQWHALPDGDRPSFPLVRPVPAAAIDNDFRPAPPRRGRRRSPRRSGRSWTTGA
jgi:hypothetical protein